MRVPQIGLKRGLLTKDPVFFEGKKVPEEGQSVPGGFHPDYMLNGEQLLVYCMALLCLCGYELDRDTLDKKVEDKMMVFPGFCCEDKQSEPIKPVYVSLKKEEE